MYGAAEVSEQALAEKALAAAPREALIVADRNFGVFSITMPRSNGVCRWWCGLTQSRAHQLVGPVCHARLECLKHRLPKTQR
jgi:hypothetical protein